MTEYHSNGSIDDHVRQLNEQYKEWNAECRKKGRPENMITVGMKPWQARNYFIDMLRALYYCHRVINVIHKDIKPDNIMIGHNDEAVLIDFGVSALLQDDRS